MKKIMFGLLVAATAVSVSAFTNAKQASLPTGAVKAGMIEANHLVNKGTNNFQQRASVSVTDCAGPSSLRCVYNVTALGKENIPEQSSYSAQDIADFHASDWIEDGSASNALYQN